MTVFAVAWVLFAASSAVLTAHAETASGPRLNLVPGSNSKLQINFGTDRSARSSTVTLLGVPPVSDAAAYPLGDLIRSDSAAQIGTDQATAKAAAGKAAAGANEAPVTVTLRVDPKGVEPGTYSGTVRVVSGTADPVSLPVTITLQGGSGLLVAFLIVCGSLLGIFAKWLAEVGAVVSEANRRYLRASAQLQPYGDDVPKLFLAEMESARTKILQLDAQASTAALDQIEHEMPTVLEMTARLREVRTLIATQAALPKLPDPANAASALAYEDQRRSEVLDTARPSDPAVVGMLDGYIAQGNALTTLLRLYPKADPAYRKDVLEPALDSFNRQDFAGGTNILTTGKPPAALAAGAPRETANAPGAPGAPGGRGAGLPSLPWQTLLQLPGAISAFLIQAQPWLSALIIGAITAVAGLQVLYFANPTFGANQSDYILVFGWGFGLQIAGTTLTQIGGALYGKGPKLA